MTVTNLEKCRRDVAATNDAIAEAKAGEDAAAQAVARAQAALATARTKVAAQQAKLVERERALAAALEDKIAEVCLDLTGTALKWHAADPRGNGPRVVEALDFVRRAWRSQCDTPINQKYSLPPLIAQGLNLLPPRDPLNTPISELGFSRSTPRETRCEQLLAEFEQKFPEPLQAA